MKRPIEVFLRHCYYSKIQELSDRTRPNWFNKNKVFENFKNTLDPKLVNYTIVYDEFYGPIDKTFLSNEENVKIINCGNEPDSFLSTLNIVQSRNFDDDQIVYFLEDDYLHRPEWSKVLLEGFTLGSAYVTLYDFNFFIDQGFLCKIFTTSSCHWRAEHATTNTFACRYKTLLEDLEIHKKYSIHPMKEQGITYSNDCQKYRELSEQNKNLISPIPGWSTHCHPKHISPVIDWKKIINCNHFQQQKNELLIDYR